MHVVPGMGNQGNGNARGTHASGNANVLPIEGTGEITYENSPVD